MSLTQEFDERLAAAVRGEIDEKGCTWLLKNSEDWESAQKIFAAARQVREKALGNTFRITGGIASVLPCRLKPMCEYCPYWRAPDLPLMTPEMVAEAAAYLVQNNIRAFHLSGGTTLGADGEDMLQILEAIHSAKLGPLEITVNCGAAMSFETLKQLKELDVAIVGSSFETMNREIFAKYKKGDSFEAKWRFAEDIGRAGLKLGSSLLCGLSPDGTKYEDYAHFIFELKKFPHLVSVYVCKFTPFPNIPLKDLKACDTVEAARAMAMLRIVHPSIDVGAAQGWRPWQGELSVTPLEAGAGNGVLGIHITPARDEAHRRVHPTVSYSERLEFMNTIEDSRKAYAQMGFTLEY